MKLIRSRLADVVHLSTSLTAVLCAVGIDYDCSFSDIVGPKRIVTGSGFVIQVVGFNDVGSIHCEEHRVERQAVYIEVCISSSDVETQPWCRECDICDIAAIYWGIFDVLLTIRSNLVAVFCLQEGRSSSYI